MVRLHVHPYMYMYFLPFHCMHNFNSILLNIIYGHRVNYIKNNYIQLLLLNSTIAIDIEVLYFGQFFNLE